MSWCMSLPLLCLRNLSPCLAASLSLFTVPWKCISVSWCISLFTALEMYLHVLMRLSLYCAFVKEECISMSWCISLSLYCAFVKKNVSSCLDASLSLYCTAFVKKQMNFHVSFLLISGPSGHQVPVLPGNQEHSSAVRWRAILHNRLLHHVAVGRHWRTFLLPGWVRCFHGKELGVFSLLLNSVHANLFWVLLASMDVN